MYFVLYDRFLNSIGETYLLESWSRVQRAVDFDELTLTGEQIPYSASPFIVVVNDKQGKYQFSGLASTPSIDDKSKKTTLFLKDYTTLFNTEIIVDWSKFSLSINLAEYIDKLLTLWKSQTDIGFTKILWDTSQLSEILWDSENIPLGSDIENVKLWDLIHDALSYYDVYCDPVLNVPTKEIIYRFYAASVSPISVRLKDFGIDYIEKSFGEFNRSTVYDYKYIKISEWALSENNNIVKLPTEKDLVYPAKNKNFVANSPSESLSYEQSLLNATYDAVMSLSENRYQENIDLDINSYTPIENSFKIDFSKIVAVYGDNGFYKDLPVGEIETDNNGKYIVRLGYRVQELTQEL